MIKLLRSFGIRQRVGLSVLLCAALFLSSITAQIGHVPQPGSLSVHAEADHGHSHEPVEDLLWSYHGHAHDQVDHDHSPIFLSHPPSGNSYSPTRQKWRVPKESFASKRAKPPERPPRV